MLAGAVAGILEHTLMFPVDTIKTRMQALAHPGQQASPIFGILYLPWIYRLFLAMQGLR